MNSTKNGEPVLDADTALRIGIEAIVAKFGREVMERNRPYRASLLHGIWAVIGTSDHNRKTEEMRKSLKPGTILVTRGGGAPGAAIASEDGRVLRVNLQR